MAIPALTLERQADALLKRARAADCYSETELHFMELREYSILSTAIVAGYDSPEVAEHPAPEPRPKPRFTRRQKEIIRLFSDLGSDTAVARHLGLTVRAVRKTLARADERTRRTSPEPTTALPGLMALIKEQFGRYVTVERTGDGGLTYHERSNYPHWLLELAGERYHGRI